METVVRRRTPILISLLLVALAAGYAASGLGDYLTFDKLREDRLLLLAYVEENYRPAVAIYILLYMLTAFVVPGAIALSLIGGFLFGTVPGALYAIAGATLGAAAAFLSARSIAGDWIHRRHGDSLRSFNEEIARHGPNYLLVLRVVPILPFFLVNYLAGMTRLPLRSFLWTTSLGVTPGAFVYAFAGRKIGSIDRPGEILSAELLAAFLLLAAFALWPVIARFLRRRPGTGL